MQIQNKHLNFLKKVRLKRPDDYKDYQFLEEYVSVHKKLLVKHKCGYQYQVTPNKFLSKRSCPMCSIKKRALGSIKDKSYYQREYIDAYLGSEYELLSFKKTSGNTIRLTIKHNSSYCGGETFTALTNKIKNGQKCPVCNGVKENYSSISKIVKQKYPEFTLSNITNLASSKKDTDNKRPTLNSNLELIHENCSHRKVIKLQTLKNSKIILCNNCHPRSKAELKVQKFLEKTYYKFDMEKTFDNCKYKQKLHFDFVIYNDDNTIKLIIEIDGIQHRKEIDFYGSNHRLNISKIRDEIKNEFCNKNGYTLLRLNYENEKQIPYIIKQIKSSLLIE